MTISVAKQIDQHENAISRFLRFCGDHTLTILALHFLSFKIINLFGVVTLGLPESQVASFPTIEGLGGCWWILYSVVGLLLPLLVAYVATKIKVVRINV